LCAVIFIVVNAVIGLILLAMIALVIYFVVSRRSPATTPGISIVWDGPKTDHF